MVAPIDIVKFPRTPHLEGSELQPGDEGLDRVARATLAGLDVTVTEKLDGINVGLRFDAAGRAWLFSRAHFIGAESWFDRLKALVASRAADLFARLGTRLVLYGEWLLARHTVFYDALPGPLVVFEAFDLDAGEFLPLDEREALVTSLGLLAPPLLWRGPGSRLPAVDGLLGVSRFVTGALSSRFEALIRARGLSLERERAQTDLSGQMEGLVFRAERDGRFVTRCKYVRPGFRQVLSASGTHWASRPFVPNLLAGSER